MVTLFAKLKPRADPVPPKVGTPEIVGQASLPVDDARAFFARATATLPMEMLAGIIRDSLPSQLR
jgi:hypothetical protein